LQPRNGKAGSRWSATFSSTLPKIDVLRFFDDHLGKLGYTIDEKLKHKDSHDYFSNDRMTRITVGSLGWEYTAAKSSSPSKPYLIIIRVWQ